MIGLAVILVLAAAAWWTNPRAKHESEIERWRSTGIGIDPKARDRSTIRRIS